MMTPMSSVVVLGSANVDTVYAVDQIPAPGETVLATSQAQHAGGKGLNQAIAAARAGAPTTLLAAVGPDAGADLLLASLDRSGVDTSLVRRSDEPTGNAMIAVASSGENAIVVSAAANATMLQLRTGERDRIEAASVLVIQLEIPLEVVAEAVTVADAAGTTVVLNAAPARRLDDALLGHVDVLVVNEHEARVLSLARTDDPIAAGRGLARGSTRVVVTLGARGAGYLDASSAQGVAEGVCPAPAVDVVDTTGAGDTFVGYLAAALASGLDIARAVERAVVAGAISVETAGAEPSIPTADQVDARQSI
jgi:ribokinase